MAQYELTEVKMYECSCDLNIKFTEKEMKLHVKSHKDAKNKVLICPSSGYSFEM
jgi:hypothetical protein